MLGSEGMVLRLRAVPGWAYRRNYFARGPTAVGALADPAGPAPLGSLEFTAAPSPLGSLEFLAEIAWEEGGAEVRVELAAQRASGGWQIQRRGSGRIEHAHWAANDIAAVREHLERELFEIPWMGMGRSPPPPDPDAAVLAIPGGWFLHACSLLLPAEPLGPPDLTGGLDAAWIGTVGRAIGPDEPGVFVSAEWKPLGDQSGAYWVKADSARGETLRTWSGVESRGLVEALEAALVSFAPVEPAALDASPLAARR